MNYGYRLKPCPKKAQIICRYLCSVCRATPLERLTQLLRNPETWTDLCTPTPTAGSPEGDDPAVGEVATSGWHGSQFSGAYASQVRLAAQSHSVSIGHGQTTAQPSGPPIWIQLPGVPVYRQTDLQSGAEPKTAFLVTAKNPPGPPIRCHLFGVPR